MASLKLGEVALNLFGVLALVMGSFIIFNTFRTVVAERRHDLGMLRALGASRRSVVSAILVESLLQGVLGTALGMLAGWALVGGLLALVSPIMQQYLHFSIGSPTFTLPIYVASILLGVGVTVLSGLWPAISAGRVTPLEALRPSVAEVYQRGANRAAVVGALLIVVAIAMLLLRQIALASLGALLFMLGLVLVAPVLIAPIARIFSGLLAVAFAREGEIAQGNLARHPGRATVTASAMMIGLAIVVALAGMTSSLEDGFMGYVDKSMGADFLLVPPSLVLAGGNVGAGPELADQIRQTPGIAAVTTLRVGKSMTKGAPLQVVGIDPETFPKVSGLEFSRGNEKTAYAELAAGRALIVNGIFAAQNGVRVGDTLTLQTAEGPRDYRVVGIGLDYLNAKLATSYISQENLKADFHESGDVLLMANKTADSDAATVRAALDVVIKPYPTFGLLDAAHWRKTTRDAFAGAMSTLTILLWVLALPSLIALMNTLAINVIERTREIGMIRAVGGTQRQVGRMILAESLLLSAAGTAFGILAGVWLGYVLIGAVNAAGFVLPYYFPYLGVLLAIAVGLLFGVLAALLPARQAARVDIVRALQYE